MQRSNQTDYLLLGLLSIGLLTDYIFEDIAKVDASIALMGCVAIPASLALLWIASLHVHFFSLGAA